MKYCILILLTVCLTGVSFATAADVQTHDIGRFKQAPEIDGVLREWDALNPLPMSRPNVDDLRVDKAYVAWDAQQVYLAVSLHDRALVNQNPISGLRMGDCFDFRIARTRRDERPLRLCIAPTTAEDKPAMVLYLPDKKTIIDTTGKVENGVRWAVKTEGKVWSVEAAIPFEVIGVTAQVAASYPFVFVVWDRDRTDEDEWHEWWRRSEYGRQKKPINTWPMMVLREDAPPKPGSPAGREIVKRAGAAADDPTLLAPMATSGLTAASFPPVTKTTDPNVFKQIRWDTSHAGREIDLGGYRKTFNDDFNQLHIVHEDEPPGRYAAWFSPGHGAYRTNSPLRKDGPFALVDEGLRMRVQRKGNRWYGACMTTVNTKGQGFAQKYGYFEATIRYDYEGDGIWGAFWAKSLKDYYTKGTTTRTEIDFNEFYGDDSYHATVHLWAARKQQSGETVTKTISASGHRQGIARELFKPLKEQGGGAVKGFHQYGGEITPEWVIMYFDRKEVARFPTMEEWKTPIYLLLDVILHAKGEANAELPIDMIVKNVSAYQRIEPYEEE